MFICFGFFLSHSRICHLYGDFAITDEGLHMLTYALLSWPLSSKGSSAYHSYCDTWHLFKIFEDHDTHTVLQRISQWSCHYLFLRLRSVVIGIRTPNFLHVRQTLWPTTPPQSSIQKSLTQMILLQVYLNAP